MRDFEQFDLLLKEALSPTAEPSEIVNQKVLKQIREKENEIMNVIHRRRLLTLLVAVILVLVMSTTAFAAWHLLDSKQVADHLGDKKLAQAFEDKSAIEINESITSGEYHFTLHGIVSGEGLSDFGGETTNINPNRTYAVLSIAKKDGSKMPSSQNDDYGSVPFFVSPLIKGLTPWQYNIASMNGGYSEAVVDGIMYRLIECDGIEMFADKGLYLCASTTPFYDVNAYNYDEKTGVITSKSDFKGANALFDLPVDRKKADPDKAKKYLKDFNTAIEKQRKDSEANEAEYEKEALEMAKRVSEGTVISDSIKVLTPDKDGMINYDYNGSDISVPLDALFREGQTGLSDYLSMDDKTATQFSRDEKGVITGKTIQLK